MNPVHIRHFYQPKSIDNFLFLHENICHMLWVLITGTSDEYPQYMCLRINKKILYGYPLLSNAMYQGTSNEYLNDIFLQQK